MSGFFKFLAVLIVLAAVGGAIWWYMGRPAGIGDGLEYRLTFQDSRGLQRGDSVTLAGKRVGEVRSVAIDPETSRAVVTIRVAAQDAPAVMAPPNTTARIITGGWLFPTRRVEIINRPGTGAPIREGDTVEGVESWAAEQAFRGRRSVDEGVQAVSQAFLDGLETARERATGPEAQSIRDKIEAVRADLEAAGLEAAGAARSRFEQVYARGRDLTQDLYRYGREDVASDLEGTLLELKSRVEHDEGTPEYAEEIEPVEEPQQ